jgi:hypothetical protein
VVLADLCFAPDFAAEIRVRNYPSWQSSRVIREEQFMSESSNDRRRPRSLSAETKWEIFLQITAGEISQAEAARKWRVDVSTVIGIRRTVKDAALAALARKPGRPGTQRDWQLEAARSEITQLTEAVKAQAIELAVVRGKSGWG